MNLNDIFIFTAIVSDWNFSANAALTNLASGVGLTFGSISSSHIAEDSFSRLIGSGGTLSLAANQLAGSDTEIFIIKVNY